MTIVFLFNFRYISVMNTIVFKLFYPFFFITLFTSFFVEGLRYQVPASSERSVASNSNLDCTRTYKLLLSNPMPKGRSTFIEKAKQLFKQKFGTFEEYKTNFKIDFHEYDWYRNEFTDLLNDNVPIPASFIKDKPEALLAFIHAMNKKNYLNIEDQVKELSLAQRKRITRIFHTLNSDTKWTFKASEDLISDLLYDTIGPEAKVFGREVMDDEKAHRRLLIRLIMEETTYKGLESVYANYRIFPGGLGKVKEFFRSNVGQAIITGAFWSPALFGATPIPYFPKLKKLRIPEQLLDEMMEKGMNNEFLEKLDKTLKSELNLGFHSNLSGRARYDVLRRRVNRYVIPAVIFWGILSDYYVFTEEMEIYNQDGEYLDEKVEQFTQIFQTITEVDDLGINILSSMAKVQINSDEINEEQKTILENREVMSNHICRDLFDCFDLKSMMVGVDFLDKDNPEHLTEIKECKAVFDGLNECPQL